MDLLATPRLLFRKRKPRKSNPSLKFVTFVFSSDRHSFSLVGIPVPEAELPLLLPRFDTASRHRPHSGRVGRQPSEAPSRMESGRYLKAKEKSFPLVAYRLFRSGCPLRASPLPSTSRESGPAPAGPSPRALRGASLCRGQHCQRSS